MIQSKILLYTIVGIGNILMAGAISQMQSAYSSIASKSCQTIKIYEMGMGASASCEKYANILVEVEDSDARMSITLIQDKKRYPLSYWNSVTYAFSSLGDKIEWRFPKGKPNYPTAMIARINASEGEEGKMISYLAVSKISKDEICVTGKIKPQKNQNILARKMADIAHELPCILNRKAIE